MSTLDAANSNLVGHDEAMRQVAEAFASGRMHHAWLITGPEGIGKNTLAYHIANHVLSSGQNPLGRIDLQHRITKLILAESHPDMLIVRRATDDKTGELRNVIVVDDALKVASFLHKTSTHGGWRVVIIDEAHCLNRFAQNAILKILEEPPSRTLLLLTVTTPGALLPTIRSRCRVLNLAPLDDAHMSDILTRTAPHLEEMDLQRLIKLAHGSIGFALKIINTESLPLYDELTTILKDLPTLDMVRLHAFADKISRKADTGSFEVILSLMMQHFQQELVQEAKQNGSSSVLDRKLQVWDSVNQTFQMADTANLDRKLAFVKAISDIRNAIA